MKSLFTTVIDFIFRRSSTPVAADTAVPVVYDQAKALADIAAIRSQLDAIETSVNAGTVTAQAVQRTVAVQTSNTDLQTQLKVKAGFKVS